MVMSRIDKECQLDYKDLYLVKDVDGQYTLRLGCLGIPLGVDLTEFKRCLDFAHKRMETPGKRLAVKIKALRNHAFLGMVPDVFWDDLDQAIKDVEDYER
jgi:hypothetical protein